MADKETKEKPLGFTDNADGSVTVTDDENSSNLPVEDKDLEGGEGGEGGTSTEDDPDARPTNSDDDDDDEGDGHPVDTHDEHGRELTKTEQNRLARQRKKNLRNEKFTQLQASLQASHQQITQLQEQLNTLNRRATGSEVVQIDAELEKTERSYIYHKGVMEAAVSAGKGAEAVAANEKMGLAQRRYLEIKRLRDAAIAQTNTPNGPAMPDPVVASKAQSWASANSWYNPTGADIDSRITREIDADLTKERFDPKTAAYWEELDRRVQKHLPHRAGGSNNGPNRGNGNRPRNTVAGSGREDLGSTTVNKGKGFTLSAERVKAMKDSGQWDNPEKRAEMTRYYREYDRTSGKE